MCTHFNTPTCCLIRVVRVVSHHKRRNDELGKRLAEVHAHAVDILRNALIRIVQFAHTRVQNVHLIVEVRKEVQLMQLGGQTISPGEVERRRSKLFGRLYGSDAQDK